MNRKNTFFLIFTFWLLVNSISILNCKGISEDTKQLAYGGCFYSENKIDKGFSIQWSFQSLNPNISILVQLMKIDDFNKFIYSVRYKYFELSDGTRIKDEGTFEIKEDDIWVIVFINQDSDQQSTSLKYSISINRPESQEVIFSNLALFIIIILSGIFGIIIVNKRKGIKWSNKKYLKREKQDIRKQDPLNSLKRCPYCCVLSDIEYNHCKFCGTKIENK